MAYDDRLDEKLRRQLLEIEDDLLDTAIVDRPTLEGFVARLSQVTEEATLCLKRGQLKPSTIQIARRVALSGKILADKLTHLHRVTEDVAKKRECEIADVFARMSLNDKPGAAASSDSSQNGPSTTKESQCPPLASHSGNPDPHNKKDKDPPSYISSARQWLKTHFHKPYPTYKEKEQILAGSKVPTKTLDDWFTNARRRIGWTALSKRFFRNKRPETIDCAIRVFVKPNPKLPVSEEISRMFEEIKTNVEKFCKDESEESEAVKMLERIMKTTGNDTSVESNKRSEKAQNSKVGTSTGTPANAKEGKGPRVKTGRKRPRSPVRDSGVKVTSAKRKRVSKPDTYEENDPTVPPLKRNRSDSQVSLAVSSSSSSIGPPTPCSGSPVAHEVLIANTDPLAPSESSISLSPSDGMPEIGSTKRKRCRSDADSADSLYLKRLRCPSVGVESSKSVNDSVQDSGHVESKVVQNEDTAKQHSAEIDGNTYGGGFLESSTVGADLSTFTWNSETSQFDWNALTIPDLTVANQSLLDAGLTTIPPLLPSYSFDFSAFNNPCPLTEELKEPVSELGTTIPGTLDQHAAPSSSAIGNLVSTPLSRESIDTAPCCTSLPESEDPLYDFLSWDALNSMLSGGQHERIPPPTFSFPPITPGDTDMLTFSQPLSSLTPFESVEPGLISQGSLPSSASGDSWASFFHSFGGEPLSVA